MSLLAKLRPTVDACGQSTRDVPPPAAWLGAGTARNRPAGVRQLAYRKTLARNSTTPPATARMPTYCIGMKNRV